MASAPLSLTCAGLRRSHDARWACIGKRASSFALHCIALLSCMVVWC